MSTDGARPSILCHTVRLGMLEMLAAVRKHTANPVVIAGGGGYAYDSASLVALEAELQKQGETNALYNFHPYMGPNQACHAAAHRSEGGSCGAGDRRGVRYTAVLRRAIVTVVLRRAIVNCCAAACHDGRRGTARSAQTTSRPKCSPCSTAPTSQ